jgi:dihydroneopterin aldolase
MSDRIEIRDLRVMARVGVTDEERATEQPLVINIEIESDLQKAGASDELGDTVDYGRVTLEIAELVRTTETKLLEHLAEMIAAHISSNDGVERVAVEVSKASPPIDEDVGSVGVRIERRAG